MSLELEPFALCQTKVMVKPAGAVKASDMPDSTQNSNYFSDMFTRITDSSSKIPSGYVLDTRTPNLPKMLLRGSELGSNSPLWEPTPGPNRVWMGEIMTLRKVNTLECKYYNGELLRNVRIEPPNGIKSLMDEMYARTLDQVAKRWATISLVLTWDAGSPQQLFISIAVGNRENLVPAGEYWEYLREMLG